MLRLNEIILNSANRFSSRGNILVANSSNSPEGERGLTDYDSFEKHIKENLANSILGTSGCGKTRLCFEALCQNYGLYLVVFPYSVGSVDLEESARWAEIRSKINNPKKHCGAGSNELHCWTPALA
ncbi:unnamed protein product [Rhizophagus irregularis]|nr:unnamed protein product [Rhizophagus irregularis]